MPLPRQTGPRCGGGSPGPAVRWSPAVREAIARIVLEGALVVENALLRATERLRPAQLSNEVHQDPLTGLADRRRSTEEVERTIHTEPHRSCAGNDSDRLRTLEQLCTALDTSWCRTTSPSWTCAPAGWSASRRSCGGSTPSAAC
ncbi:hypothetical protein [Geodermatophilus sp. URMC 62]|uniref:hypothetical protein n=1 Tax=Geodermatophilus sp. URMC 62 TaxID=3423414 RepID=UPI00406D0D69